jgi:hypothetical protein
LEFDDFYLIQPGTHQWDYVDSKSYNGQQSRPVPADFEYASNTNSRWLEIDELRAIIA